MDANALAISLLTAHDSSKDVTDSTVVPSDIGVSLIFLSVVLQGHRKITANA
jgi:hypothetical protein